MTIAKLLFRAACVFGSLIAFCHAADALDLTGTWASDASACTKIFVRNGNNISIAQDSDVYGDGFIFEADRIRGKIVSCSIKSKKEDGNVLHVIASCSQEVMIGMAQFSLRVDNANQITRIFPGDADMNTSYYRCTQ